MFLFIFPFAESFWPGRGLLGSANKSIFEIGDIAHSSLSNLIVRNAVASTNTFPHTTTLP